MGSFGSVELTPPPTPDVLSGVPQQGAHRTKTNDPPRVQHSPHRVEIGPRGGLRGLAWPAFRTYAHTARLVASLAQRALGTSAITAALACAGPVHVVSHWSDRRRRPLHSHCSATAAMPDGTTGPGGVQHGFESQAHRFHTSTRPQDLIAAGRQTRTRCARGAGGAATRWSVDEGEQATTRWAVALQTWRRLPPDAEKPKQRACVSGSNGARGDRSATAALQTRGPSNHQE